MMASDKWRARLRLLVIVLLLGDDRLLRHQILHIRRGLHRLLAVGAQAARQTLRSLNISQLPALVTPRTTYHGTDTIIGAFEQSFVHVEIDRAGGGPAVEEGHILAHVADAAATGAAAFSG